ncbi:MAG: hypothetical protein ABIQ41_07810 [Gemmatimonadales bacterium]
MRPLLTVIAVVVFAGKADGQAIGPHRSLLFESRVRTSQPTTLNVVSGKKDRLSPTTIGAVLFGVAAGAVVYEADAGPSNAKLPIVIGATVAGGLLGYLIGGLLGPSDQ